MKRRLLEESVLFVSILKWTALAMGAGAIVGVSTAVFLKVLVWGIDHFDQYQYYFLILPLALFASGLITKYVAQEAKGYGTEKVIEAVHRHSGHMRLLVVPVKLVATVVTATFGGSVGQIGPCGQMGAALSSFLARILRFGDQDRKKLVICGISAGFASVLGAPIAGAIFGLEVLSVGAIMYEVLLPSFVAGMTSFHVSSLMGITYMHLPLGFLTSSTESFFLKAVIAGILFGLCAVVTVEILGLLEKGAARISLWDPLKGILGGLVLAGLAILFSRQYLGLGFELTHIALKGETIVWYAFLLKIIFTGLTFGSGGSGGIIAPLICIGAAAGSFFGDVLQADRATFAAIGFVSVLAGAANTPIAASILAMELFGGQIAPYAAVSCVVSFLITGHRGIFPTQLVAFKKSSSIDVEIGKEVGDVKAEFKPRDKSLIGLGLRVAKKVRNHRKREG